MAATRIGVRASVAAATTSAAAASAAASASVAAAAAAAPLSRRTVFVVGRGDASCSSGPRAAAAAAAAAAAFRAGAPNDGARRSTVAVPAGAATAAAAAAAAASVSSSSSSSLRVPSRRGLTGTTAAGTTTPPPALRGVRVITASSTDPLFNLATEEWLFRHGDVDVQSLFLWRNAACVVIGRNQNAFKECHVQRMEDEGVTLARRHSGGGAVFQDLGNTCFTFLSHIGRHDKARNSAILTRAIDRFGIDAKFVGRNDLVVGDRKVSGSAYKISRDRALHHGTLLIDVDFGALGRYLNPDKAKLQSKGVASVQARVANLRDFNPDVAHDALCDAIREEFFDEYGMRAEVEHLDTAELETIPHLRKTWEELQDWQWRFGETPDFTHNLEHRFDWGNMDVHIDSHHGRIRACKIYSDALDPKTVAAARDALDSNITYDRAAVVAALNKAAGQAHDDTSAEHLREVAEWLGYAL